VLVEAPKHHLRLSRLRDLVEGRTIHRRHCRRWIRRFDVDVWMKARATKRQIA
jgi:hypothetical protein